MSYTLEQLKELVDELGLDDNAKIALLIGKVDDTHYQIVAVDEDGNLKVAS
jgi:hypothetical protein